MSVKSSKTDLATACAALAREPLFHMSHGSQELFHSDLLAWFADQFPDRAAAVFAPWALPQPGARANLTEREVQHYDLILHLPGLAPIVIENKVLSVPDEQQLDRY